MAAGWVGLFPVAKCGLGPPKHYLAFPSELVKGSGEVGKHLIRRNVVVQRTSTHVVRAVQEDTVDWFNEEPRLLTAVDSHDSSRRIPVIFGSPLSNRHPLPRRKSHCQPQQHRKHH